MVLHFPGDTGDQATAPKVLGLTDFSGLNTNSTRPAIADQEMSWVLNFIPIGKGNLRTLWGIGDTIYGINGNSTSLPPLYHIPVNYCYYFTMTANQQQTNTSLPNPTPNEWMFAAGPSASLFQLYNITQGKLFLGEGPLGEASGSVRVQAAAWNNEALLIVDGTRLLAWVPFTYPANDPNHPNDLVVAQLGPGAIAPVLTLTASGYGYKTATDQPIGATITGGHGAEASIYPIADPAGAIISMGIISGGFGYVATDAPVAVTFTDNPNGQVTATATESGGSVTAVTVSNGGNYWTGTPTVTFSGGGGSGATAQALLTATSVKRLDVVAGGNSFDYPPLVFVLGGGGSGATATANLAPAGVGSIPLLSQGSGYTSPPDVVFSGGGGSGAAATTIIGGGKVLAVLVTANGSGYTTQPEIVLQGGGGLGAVAYAELNSYVESVTLVSAGSGYTTTPLGIAVQQGGGQLTLTISGGVITAATVLHTGQYYFAPSVTVVDQNGTGSGAVITTALGPTALHQDMFYVVAQGSGYTENTTTSVALTISGGGGAGATGYAVVNGIGNIVGVNLTSGGSGYTSAPTVAIASVSGAGGASIACLPYFPIASASVTNGGTGYSNNTFAIVGDGITRVAKTVLANLGVALTDTSVASITVINGGTGYTSAPTVIVGGTGASGTISLMPFGAGGTCIEIYQERVWTGNGTTMLFSAAGNPYDFNTPDGAGAFSINELYLRRQITALKQVNGFLYVFGDSSIFVVSNIQSTTSGSPTVTTTTLSVYNIDAQIGTPWRDTVQQYGYGIIFCNPDGVYAITGGASQKISMQLNGLFANIVQVAPNAPNAYSAAVATVYGLRCYFVLINTTDYLGNPTQVMCAYNGTNWFLANQCYNLNYVTLLGAASTTSIDIFGTALPLQFIATKELNTDISVIGTEGLVVFDMFNAPDGSLQKVVQTKLWPGDDVLAYKQVMRVWGILSPPVVTSSPDVSAATLNIDNEQQYTVSTTNAISRLSVNDAVTLAGTNISAFGLLLGITYTTTIADTSLVALMLHYKDTTPYA